jgi:hypothetical protein
MTSVIVPPINDWSNYRPQKNWWLLYVQWGEGALLSNPKIPEPVFSSTRIFAVRDQEFTFSVSPGPFKLGLMKYGLFFDVEGKFVGSLRWKWDDDPASVTGFPRICTVAGGSSNDRSLLNCNSTREKLWGKIAPNPTQTSTPSPRPSPTPSPSISAIDASVEAYDAFKAALESYNLVREAKNDCLKAYRSSDTSISRILNLVSGSRNCSSQDVLVNAAYQRLLSLDPAKSTVKDSLVLIDRLNDVTDQFNNFAEALDEGIVFAEELRDSANDLEEVEALIEVLGTLSSSIETVLERLPSKIKNSLYLKTEVATFIDLNNEFLETSEEFTDALSQFSGSLDVDFEALEKFKLSIALASRLLPSEESMDDAQTNALKVIPSFYCKKGKTVSLPSKGKCPSGASKIKIDKTW